MWRGLYPSVFFFPFVKNEAVVADHFWLFSREMNGRAIQGLCTLRTVDATMVIVVKKKRYLDKIVVQMNSLVYRADS